MSPIGTLYRFPHGIQTLSIKVSDYGRWILSIVMFNWNLCRLCGILPYNTRLYYTTSKTQMNTINQYYTTMSYNI